MRKIFLVTVTAVVLSVGFVNLSHAQRMVVINGKRLAPQELANLEQRCGTILDGIYRVQGDYWWNVLNPLHAGRVSELCNGNRGSGMYRQGNGVGEVYNDGSSAHRNSTLGQGVIIDPNAGGSWQDRVFITR